MEITFTNHLNNLKSNGQDFEFYPTTTEILACVANDIKLSGNIYQQKSLLDIGAGNGKVLKYFKNSDINIYPLYGIEKSKINLSIMSKEFSILGVDFHQNSLMDKDIDIIFCNPPYSEFESWAKKIIKEAQNKSTIYLVIPERWICSDSIHLERGNRDCKYTILRSFDFINSEDRKARAKVEIVKITYNGYKNKAFETFFNETFNYPENITLETPKKSIPSYNIVEGQNLIEILCDRYNEEMNKLYVNYESVCKLDPSLLIEFELTKEMLIKSLEIKINSSKLLFWNELFNNLDTVKSRLTKKSRRKILDFLNKQTCLDFNIDNCYAIITWVIHNAYNYFNEQFIETYEDMLNKANVINYKSNQKVFVERRFRYDSNDEQKIKIKTGHRIVVENCGGLYQTNSTFSWEKGLSENAANYISDLITIANNLGFSVNEAAPLKQEWDDSNNHDYSCIYKGKEYILFSVKAFKKGNMHFKFLPLFIHAMNIQYGKLKGWLHNSEDIFNEEVILKNDLDEISIDEITELYNYELKITINNLFLTK